MILVEGIWANIEILGPPSIPNERVQTNEMLKISIFTHIPSTGVTSFHLHESVVNPELLDTVAQLHG